MVIVVLNLSGFKELLPFLKKLLFVHDALCENVISYTNVIHAAIDLDRIEERETIEPQMFSPELAHGDIAVGNIRNHKLTHPLSRSCTWRCCDLPASTLL